MGKCMVSDPEKEPLGSCISLKDDMASVQRMEAKHLTFSPVRLGCDRHSPGNAS